MSDVATKAVIGNGSRFYTGVDGSPIVYTEVLETAVIKLPETTTTAIDVSHLNSPSLVMEFLPGMTNPGTLEISGNYSGDTSQEALSTLIHNRTVFPFKATAPCEGGTAVVTITGRGFLTKSSRGSAEVNKKLEFSASLQVSGVVTATIA